MGSREHLALEAPGPGASRWGGEHDMDFKDKESEGGLEGCEFLRWKPSGRGAWPARGQLPTSMFFAVFVGPVGTSGVSAPCPANSSALESQQWLLGTYDQH